MEAPDLKPGVRVLAEHPARTGPNGAALPVVLMHYVGAGKVVFHCTDETWRWRRRVGDVYFARYWVQTLRDLSRSALLDKDRKAELSVDREEYRRGDAVRLRVRFFDDRLAPLQDDGVVVVLEQEGGKRRRLGLRRDAPSAASSKVWRPTCRKESIALGLRRPRWKVRCGAAVRRRRAAGRTRPVGNGRRRPEVRGRSNARASSTPSRPPAACSTICPAAGRCGSNRCRRSRFGTPGSWPALFVSLLVAEWLLRKKVGMV